MTAAAQSVLYHPPLQGDNGTFLLSLNGQDAEAFNVSPERAAGSVSVQVVVRNSEMVDYEKETVMVVEVWCAEMLRDTGTIGNWALVPCTDACSSVLRLWPLTQSATTTLLPR